MQGAHSGHNAKVGDGQLGTGQIGIIRQKYSNFLIRFFCEGSFALAVSSLF